MQNRIVLPPDSIRKFYVESRDYVPGPDRDAIRRIIPTENTAKVVVAWRRAANDQLELVTGVPGNDSQGIPHPQEVRTFPTHKLIQAMLKAVPMSVPLNHRVAVWWEPSPSDEDANEKVCTIYTGIIRDENAPKPITGDGLDAMDETKLLTIAGMEGAKGNDGKPLHKGQTIGDLVENVRQNRIRKSKSKEPTLVTA